MSAADLAGARFSVSRPGGAPVVTGVVGSSTGRWSTTYRYVEPVVFTSLSTPGTYSISVDGPAGATSPTFTVAPAPILWDTPLANALRFYENERDGPDYVPSALRTAPAHLNDEHAMTYATPAMRADGQFAGNLTPLAVTVDASGGWWDAGDYLKFVETTSYAEALLEVGARSFPSAMGSSAGALQNRSTLNGRSWAARYRRALDLGPQA